MNINSYKNSLCTVGPVIYKDTKTTCTVSLLQLNAYTCTCDFSEQNKEFSSC